MDDESIYGLIPLQPNPPAKTERYKSVFHEAVRDEVKLNKALSKTMGAAKVPLSDTKNFLKKKQSEPQEKKKFVRPNVDQKKPPVPKRDENPVMGIKSNKNFLQTNAVDTIMSVAKKPEPRYVDTSGGTINNLNSSGLVPTYTKKEDYGSVPKYLVKRKAMNQENQEAFQNYLKEQRDRGALCKIGDEERQVILNGLKKNWSELHLQYQGLSVVTDTAPKKARKERMEAEMKQLEKYIDTIEKHRVIYVTDNF